MSTHSYFLYYELSVQSYIHTNAHRHTHTELTNTRTKDTGTEVTICIRDISQQL